MSTYYEYQDVKRLIAHRLMNMDGWKVYGYHSDDSDLMTDYYSPAWWNGIATKNGYMLVVDHSFAQAERRYTIRKAGFAAFDEETAAKIKKLEQMTQARGASEQEEATAKAKIELLKNKIAENEADAIEEIVEPGHMANPPRCNWHIEKDGIIIEKGTGLLKFSNLPDITFEREQEAWQKFNNLSREEWIKDDIRQMKNHRYGFYSESDSEIEKYATNHYEEAAEKYQLLEKFNALISKFNSTCGGMMGNTTDFYTYQEVVETQYKTEIKPIETKSGSLKDGQCFILKSSFNYGRNKGYVYRIHEYTWEGRNVVTGKTDKYYIAYRMNGKNTKECTGSANQANCWSMYSERDMEKFLNWIEKGNLAWCELQEVKTPYEVKKVVKVKAEAEPKATENNETPEAEPEKTKAAQPEKNSDVSYSLNEQYNGIEITFKTRPSIKIRDELKQNGFRWHGQKKLWYAKQSERRIALAKKLASA